MRETSDFSYVERAGKILDTILRADASHYEARRLRNEVDLHRHNFDAVVASAQALSKIAPGDPANWAALGDALMEKGEYERAAEAYDKMLALAPGPASYNRAAWYRFVTGDPEGSIEAMRKAVSAGGFAGEKAAWCLAELGAIQFKTGRMDEARRSYEAALRAFPGYHPAHAGMGRVLAAVSAFIGVHQRPS